MRKTVRVNWNKEQRSVYGDMEQEWEVFNKNMKPLHFNEK